MLALLLSITLIGAPDPAADPARAQCQKLVTRKLAIKCHEELGRPDWAANALAVAHFETAVEGDAIPYAGEVAVFFSRDDLRRAVDVAADPKFAQGPWRFDFPSRLILVHLSRETPRAHAVKFASVFEGPPEP